MWTNPFQAFAGIFLIALGLPVYYYLTKNSRESTIEDR
jgi:hypothetical protein